MSLNISQQDIESQENEGRPSPPIEMMESMMKSTMESHECYESCSLDNDDHDDDHDDDNDDDDDDNDDDDDDNDDGKEKTEDDGFCSLSSDLKTGQLPSFFLNDENGDDNGDDNGDEGRLSGEIEERGESLLLLEPLESNSQSDHDDDPLNKRCNEENKEERVEKIGENMRNMENVGFKAREEEGKWTESRKVCDKMKVFYGSGVSGRPATPAPWISYRNSQDKELNKKFSFDSGIQVTRETTPPPSLSLFQSLASSTDTPIKDQSSHPSEAKPISCSPYSTGPAYSLFPKPANATNVVNFAKSETGVSRSFFGGSTAVGPGGDSLDSSIPSRHQLCHQIYNNFESNPSLFCNPSKLDPNSKPFSPATRTQNIFPLMNQRSPPIHPSNPNASNAAATAALLLEVEKLTLNATRSKIPHHDINNNNVYANSHFNHFHHMSNGNNQHQYILNNQYHPQHQLYTTMMKNTSPNNGDFEIESALPLKYRNASSFIRPKNNSSVGRSFPTSVRKDDFGLIGLLNNIQESSRSLNSSKSTVLSQTELGFPPDYQRNVPYLSQVMESPFSNKSLSVFSDHNIPSEYCHSELLAGRLPPPGSHYLPTDFLFFLFYVAVGDALQILAGSQLFDRGWRYNKVNQIWFARVPGVPPEERNAFYEQGTYQYFDVKKWTRTKGKFTLNYHELAEHINPPNELRGMINNMNQLQQRRKEMALAILRNNPRLISSLNRH